jgi:hypothetical protein
LRSNERFTFRLLVSLGVLALALAGCSKKGSERRKPSLTTSPLSATSQSALASPQEASGSRRPSSPNPAPKGSVLQPGSIEPTAAGNYSYRESGGSGFNCGVPRTEQAPDPTSLKIDPAHGSAQRSLRDRTKNGYGIVTTQDWEFRPEGIYLSYLHERHVLPRHAYTLEFRPNPPMVVVPKDLAAGRTWEFSMTSTDGQVKVDVTNGVESSEDVTIADGSAVPTARIRSSTHASGKSDGGALDTIENVTWWFSIRDRLVPREISDGSGVVGGCTTSSHFEALIASTTPS